MDMIKYEGLGVAMGNAPDEVKVIANEVTLSNNENGLKHTLQKYF
jgi:hydroxymethylpyrimidine pyrophosphatase-like HAD family hydrolase